VTAAIEIDEIHETAALARLAPEWWALWERSTVATPFQSPAWLSAWWTAFAAGKLRILAAWDNGRLRALAPLYLDDGPLGRRLLPIGISLSDFVDVLVDPEAAWAGEAIVQALSRSREHWDVWEMGSLLPGATALTLSCPADCTEAVEDAETCPVLHLAPGPCDAGLHHSIPALQRRKLRMARHRLDRHGNAAILSTHQLSRRDWLNALVELHTRRWEERGELGILADPRVQSFHDEALESLIERGIARLFALTIGGETAGIYYGFLDRGRAYAYLGGFDPRFSYYSPGTVLLGHAIEEALRDGAQEFHFLRGGEAYKYAWGAVDMVAAKRTFVRNTSRG